MHRRRHQGFQNPQPSAPASQHFSMKTPKMTLKSQLQQQQQQTHHHINKPLPDLS